MAKTGPTPTSTSNHNLARRRPGPVLHAVPVELPGPGDWLPATRDAYYAYAEAEVARLLRDEDIPQVVLLFDLRDKLARLLPNVPGPTNEGGWPDTLKALQAVKTLDGMIARLASELGIGPLARTRLGILQAEGAEKASKLDQFLSGDGNDA